MKDDRSQLILYIGGELPPDEAAALEDRLREDQALSEELEQLRKTMQLIENHVPDEPGAEYWNSFYQRLQPKLHRKGLLEQAGEWLMPKHGFRLAWALGILAVVFVVVSILLSQAFFGTEPDILVKETSITIERTEGFLQRVVNDHLERSRLLLQEMVNIADSREYVEDRLAVTRVRGEQLLSDNRTYRLAAEQEANDELIALLDDLELVLLEIANLDPQQARYTLPTVQRIIRKKNLLIKIEIINLDEQQFVTGRPETEVT